MSLPWHRLHDGPTTHFDVCVTEYALSVQAAILTGRRSKTAISNKEVDDSVDRIVAGMEGTPMVDGKAKSLVAYHEVGHAVCGTLTAGHDPVQKVSSAAVVPGLRAEIASYACEGHWQAAQRSCPCLQSSDLGSCCHSQTGADKSIESLLKVQTELEACTR